MENINNINLGKIQPKKLTKKEKTEVEKQIIEQRNDSEVAGKGASKASRAYAAALIALGLMSGAGMTSCTDVENISESKAETNNEEMLNLLKQLLNTQNAILAQLKANGEENSKENQQMIKLLQEQNKILTNIMSGITDIKTGLAQIQTLIENANANDAEFLAKIDKIIDGQATDSEKLDKILEENQKQTEYLANISPYIETIAQFDQETAETLNAFYEDYKAGQLSHSEFTEKLLEAVEKNTSVSQEILDKIAEFKEAYDADKITEGELLAKIAELLENIDSNVAALLEKVTDMADDIVAIKDKMDENQDASIEVLQTIADNTGNINTNVADIIKNQVKAQESLTEISGKIDGIGVALDAINEKAFSITDLKDMLGPLFDEIKDKLDGLGNGDTITKEELKEILNEYKTDLTKTNALIETLTNVVQNLKLDGGEPTDISEIVELLKGIKTNDEAGRAELNASMEAVLEKMGDMQGTMDAILEASEGAKEAVDSISVKLDTANTTLEAINAKEFTLDELKEVLGPLFDDLKDKIDNINTGDTITKEELQEVLNEYKTDLTKTNALIETLTNVVQNLKLEGGTTVDLTELTELLNEIKDNDKLSSEAIQAKFDEAIAKLGNLEVAVKALQTVAEGLGKNFDKAMDAAGKKFAEFFAEFQGFAEDNAGNLNKLIENGDAVKEQLVEAQKTRLEQLEVMKAILANQGKDNGNGKFEIDYDKLKELMPADYTDILNEISSKLGNVITSSDLENFFIKTQPDLTKTNALIETLTNVVQNKNFAGGSGSADMTKVENLLGNILDAINAKQAPTPEQIDEAIKLLNKIVGNTETPTSRMVSSRSTEEYVDLASASDIATSFQITPEMIANAYKHYNA